VGAGRRQKVIAPSEEECEHKVWQLIERAQTHDLSKAPTTVSVLAEDWLAKVNTRTNRAVSTRANAEADVRRLIIGQAIGKHRVDRLTVQHVEAWLEAMARRGYKKPTMEMYRKHLHQIIDRGIALRMLTVNVVAMAEWPAEIEESRQHIAFTPEEATKFVEWCSLPEEPWGPFLLLCVLLGARPGEAFGLRWQHVDLDAGTVHIGWALKRAKDRPIGLGPTKNEHTRTLDMPPVLVAALRRQQAAQETARIVYGDTWPAQWNDHVFLTDEGVPCFQSNVRKQVTRACFDAGVRRLTPYELRHSCASYLIPRLGITKVADLLGTSERMLRRHYHHITDIAQPGAVQAWAELIAD
jgi:integrase